MLPFLSFFISLAGLLVGTYTDFKERIIPDILNYALLLLGLGIAAYEFFSTSNPNPLIVTVAAVIGTFVLAYAFWKLGAWAGGDVKLFVALAALNPYNPFFLGTFLGLDQHPLFGVSSLPIFMLFLFVFSVIAFIPYTALLSLVALKHKTLRKDFLSKSADAFKQALLVVLWTSLVWFALPSASWEVLLALILISFLPRPIKLGLAGLGALALFLNPSALETLVISFAALSFVSIFLTWFSFAKKHVLVSSKKILSLEEGEIPGEWIELEKGKPVRKSPPSIGTLIKAKTPAEVMQWFNFMQPSPHTLANPASAAGLTQEQVDQLKSLVKKGDLEDHIRIKASAPFVPAVLLAYIFLNLVGDLPWVWWLP